MYRIEQYFFNIVTIQNPEKVQIARHELKKMHIKDTQNNHVSLYLLQVGQSPHWSDFLQPVPSDHNYCAIHFGLWVWWTRAPVLQTQHGLRHLRHVQQGSGTNGNSLHETFCPNLYYQKELASFAREHLSLYGNTANVNQWQTWNVTGFAGVVSFS